jgi:hypothetical protein
VFFLCTPYRSVKMSDDEHTIPLQDQRVFGAGIKRERISFVPAASPPPATVTKASGEAAADRYLSVVMKGRGEGLGTDAAPPTDAVDGLGRVEIGASLRTCEVCKLPIREAPPADDLAASEAVATPRRHEASLAHQVCVAHSHPPSHLERSGMGIKYLTSCGWDPDGRRGLGARGEGMRAPIKATVKNDTAGLGLQLKERSEKAVGKRVERLDAGKLRKRDAKERRKAERLRQLFYGNGEVDRYLGAP